MTTNRYTQNFNPDEILAASSDAIRMRLGEAVQHPHPLASAIGLPAIAAAAGLKRRPQSPNEAHVAALGRGMSTSDFGRILAEGASGVVHQAYLGQAEHRKFARHVELRDFKPTGWPAPSSDTALRLTGDLGEIQYGSARLSEESVLLKLMSYSRILVISRRDIINDQFDGIQQAFSDVGANAGRAEAQLVAEALETPPVMNDGGQVFAADYKNVVASALDAASLGVAMGYLRMQLTPSGTTSGLRARHLIVAADLEMLAMSIVLDIGADIDVSVVAELPNGRWYLTADHQTHPTIVTTRLKGTMLPVRLDGAKCPDGADGVGIRVMADIGAAIIRRDGIIRGGV